MQHRFPLQLLVLSLTQVVLMPCDGDRRLVSHARILCLCPACADVAAFVGAFQSVLAGALILAIVSFMELYSIAKVQADKRGYKLDPSQELIALGASNAVGSVFQAYPLGGSFARTVVSASSGASPCMTL